MTTLNNPCGSQRVEAVGITKSEVRNPMAEENPKPAGRIRRPVREFILPFSEGLKTPFGFRISGNRISDFGVGARRTWAFCILHLTFCIFPWRAQAFPPAPNALIYGMVKDQYGTPLRAGAQVLLQTPGGVQVTGLIQPGLAVGINYTVSVPMDAGTAGGLYTANAVLPSTAYRLWVVSGTTTNLPLEMVANSLPIGIPASLTRQDLTLGVDINGDGIPDAWEQAFLSEIGANLTLAQINPNADYARDGRTLRQEYLLGNYPFNPADHFQVQLVSQSAGSAVLAFTTMTGRAYTAYGSSDLQNWTPLAFSIPAAGPAPMNYYTAPGIQPLQVQTIPPTNGLAPLFFRLQLQ